MKRRLHINWTLDRYEWSISVHHTHNRRWDNTTKELGPIVSRYGNFDWLGSWFVGTGTSWSFWISKNMLLFASEVGLDIDENNIFLWIRPKMSMISIMWSLERSVVRPWLQGHHHWFTSEYHGSNGLSPWFLLCLRCRDRRCSCASCWWSERFPSLIASLD